MADARSLSPRPAGEPAPLAPPTDGPGAAPAPAGAAPYAPPPPRAPLGAVRARKGAGTLDAVPAADGLYSRTFMVEPTTFCNLRCPLCPVPTRLGRPAQHMALETYRRLVDALAGHAERLDLWNFGEPFLHPQLFEMIRYATDRGIVVRVSTNATLLGEREIEGIFWSNLSAIIVCLDGARKETHERYRVGSQFEAVVAGIRRLAAARRTRSRRAPFIRLQCLVFRYNEAELDDMIALARAMGVDQLTLKNVSLGTWLPTAVRERLARMLLPENDAYRKYRVEDGRLRLKDGGGPCSWAYENGVVLANGDVTTCCYDSSGAHVFANVDRDGDLLQILQSETMRRVRQEIRDRTLPLCGTCQYSDFGATHITFEDAPGPARAGSEAAGPPTPAS